MDTRKKLQEMTDADRALGRALIIQTQQTAEYHLCMRWIKRAHLCPRRCYKTCSVRRVRMSMLESTGIAVSEDSMLIALAASGFIAREIGGELSTNCYLSWLPKGDQIIDMSGPDA